MDYIYNCDQCGQKPYISYYTVPIKELNEEGSVCIRCSCGNVSNIIQGAKNYNLAIQDWNKKGNKI